MVGLLADTALHRAAHEFPDLRVTEWFHLFGHLCRPVYLIAVQLVESRADFRIPAGKSGNEFLPARR